MKNEIVAAREQAARAVKAARELGLQITEKTKKNEPAGELQAQFDKAHADSVAAISEVNHLEAMAQLDADATRLERPEPVATVAHRAGEPSETQITLPSSRRERMERRRMQGQREAFARAGVGTIADFNRFKEAHGDAFIPFCAKGYGAAAAVFEGAGFKPAESMALVTTSGDLGGFLLAEDLRNEVLKDLAGFAIMRRICRVEPTGSSVLVFPSLQSASTDADIYSTGFAGSWRAEGAFTDGTTPTVQNYPKFGQTRVPVHLWQPDAVEITTNLLEDATADVEGIIAEAIAEVRALDEDSAFIQGGGVDKPLGLTESGLSHVHTGDADDLTYGGIVDLFTGLPSQYRANARFLMNSLTYGEVLKLADDEGHLLFPPGQPVNAIYGKPIEFSEFLPDVSAGTYPIIFGDFRYYIIADRQELRVQRLTEKYAPNIGLLPTARLGGRVSRIAAFRRQYVAAGA
jgi:HK97 family phage major capsid protein